MSAQASDPAEVTQNMRLRARLRRWLNRARRALAPSPQAWRGAAVGLATITLVIWLWFNLPLMTPAAPWPPLILTLLGLVVAVLVAGLIVLLLRLLLALPGGYRLALLAAVILLLVATLSGPSQTGGLVVLVLAILAGSVAGGAAYALATNWRQMAMWRRVVALLLLVVSVGLLLGSAWWLLQPGAPAPDIADAAAAGGEVAPLSLPDPTEPGPYAVQTLTYGSGADRHRPEYGAEVDIVTESVDARRLVSGWDGFTGWARTGFWGFDDGALPRNARVWYPGGDGPFPLVLVVHGNHLAEDFSDPGYDYLGELLASRGYIVASVDENFLNGMLSDIAGGLEEENDARGWLLLEHLKLWHAWNEDPENPFFGQVDTGNIALVGHSRGGEAVAVAAAFNRLPYYPDNARLRFDYDYDIQSVVAIAPIDGQYRPADVGTPLTDVSYLTLQGSHDGDVNSFDGLNQYHRLTFSPGSDTFKSAVYVYRANHGQFNTTWGAYDRGEGLTERLLNRAALLPAAAQRQAARVYISAFLDATLRGADGYRPLFRDHRYGAGWLPDTIYLTQYADAGATYVADYEDDLDLTSITVPGRARGRQLTVWREERVNLRFGEGDNRAVVLGWDSAVRDDEASYTLRLDAPVVADGASLVFDLAAADQDPSPGEAPPDGEEADAEDEAVAQPLDLTVTVTDTEGDSASLPLSTVAALQPPIRGAFLKAEWLHDGALTEPIFQTFRFPLAAFVEANPAFDASALRTVGLTFDGTEAGVVLLDNVGVQR
jgi:dienelactone hydrolase